MSHLRGEGSCLIFVAIPMVRGNGASKTITVAHQLHLLLFVNLAKSSSQVVAPFGRRQWGGAAAAVAG
ncbi:MAG: hypothetical protein QOK12_1432 [Mycobacterium sp.]|nr:hypothetical protein [Mycobacterium sp.]